MTSSSEIITLGGGCFWYLQAVFADLRGVERVDTGYMGGTISNPTYEQVCSSTNWHAEIIHITFTPSAVTLKEILEVFFTVHDPTTLNQQGKMSAYITAQQSFITLHNKKKLRTKPTKTVFVIIPKKPTVRTS